MAARDSKKQLYFRNQLHHDYALEKNDILYLNIYNLENTSLLSKLVVVDCFKMS
jgi:hypothetical protein